MKISSLMTATTNLLNQKIDENTEFAEIDTGLESLTSSIKTIATASASNHEMIEGLSDLIDSVHAKIDGTITLFANLGEIAASLISKGESVLEELKMIYNLMISLIKALRPVQALATSKYPLLIPLFEILNALPVIP